MHNQILSEIQKGYKRDRHFAPPTTHTVKKDTADGIENKKNLLCLMSTASHKHPTKGRR